MIKLYQNEKLVANLNVNDFVGEVVCKQSLNREYTIDFSIDRFNEKAKYLTSDTKVVADGVTYTLNHENCIEYESDKQDVLRIRGEGLYKDLENVFVEPFLSNDPNTPIPADLTVMIVGGGKDLSGGKYKVGTAAHALYAILDKSKCGWTVGTVDVDGIFDLEVEKKSVLGLIDDIQKIWGGYVVWDFDKKVIHLRSEKKWAINRGFRLNENKNVRIVKTQVEKAYDRVFPFGENYLDIAKVNGGVKYVGSGDRVKICENPNIKDQEELLKWGKEQLAYYSKDRFNYSCDIVDVREIEGYESEVFELGDMVTVRTNDGVISEPMRIISIERNLLKRFEVKLEVGEPMVRLEEVLKQSLDTADRVGKIINPDGRINGKRLADSSVIGDSIDKAAIDASKFNVKQIILSGEKIVDDVPNKTIHWNTHKVFYDGKEYEIPAGKTNKKHVIWRHGSNNYECLTDIEFENKPLADNDFPIFINNDGVHDVAWYSRLARGFIGAVFIADASINNAKIRDLSAVKITTGRLQSVDGETWIDLDTGDFSFKGGALRWNAEKQELEIGSLSGIDKKFGDLSDLLGDTKTELEKKIKDTDTATRTELGNKIVTTNNDTKSALENKINADVSGAKSELNTKINNNVNTINETIAVVDKKADDNKRYYIDELGKVRKVNADNYAELSATINENSNALGTEIGNVRKDVTEQVRVIKGNIDTAVNGAKSEMKKNLQDAIASQDKSIREVQESVNNVATTVLEKAKENNRIWYVISDTALNSNGVNGKSWATLTPTRPKNADHNGDIAVIGGMIDDFMKNIKVYYNGRWIPLAEGAFLIENKDYNGVKVSASSGIQIYNSNGTLKSEWNKDKMRFYGSPTQLPESYTSPVPFSEVNNGGMQFAGLYGTSRYLRDIHIAECSTINPMEALWYGDKSQETSPGGKAFVWIDLPERFRNYKKDDVQIFVILKPGTEIHNLIGNDFNRMNDYIMEFDARSEYQAYARMFYNEIGDSGNRVGIVGYKMIKTVRMEGLTSFGNSRRDVISVDGRFPQIYLMGVNMVVVFLVR